MIKRLNFFSPKGIFFLCLALNEGSNAGRNTVIVFLTEHWFPLFAKSFICQILIESRNVRFGFCQVFIEGVVVGK